jgi:3',5'-cyclic AMP phosphodiesterase CpdA
MKRRRFLRDLGLGGSGVILAEQAIGKSSNRAEYSYGQITSLKDAVTQEGLINVRLEFRSKTQATLQSARGKISVSKGKLARMKEYFFEQGEDVLDGQQFDVSVSHEKTDIIATWIADADPDTRIQIKDGKEKASFVLQELVEKQELNLDLGEMQITANLLLDREIGEIAPSDFNATGAGDNFRFAVLADPQGGDPEEEGNHPTRMKIHNAWIEETTRQTNIMNPVATLILGDIVDGQGQQRNFVQMAEYFKKLESPILYAMGNHETKYRSVFSPGYNMEAFNNYFEAQKKINGLELILYSFNLGKWHFIVWPDPLRNNFWETHPHYFDWLERDLEKYQDRPTVFFQHVPSHPIGINPLINYAESVDVKRTVLNILSKHGNVKYIFSGHVHIPIKASFKTAVNIHGMKLINLPPAGYRPRAFGEQDYHGGPCQGLLVLDFNGQECKATFRTVMEEEYVYPDELPELDQKTYALWLNHKWELPASDTLLNGNFNNSLEGWKKRYVYTEDENPSNIAASRTVDGKPALFLYSRKRGFDMPGQDRLPQTINRVCQAVALKNGENPRLSFRYKIDQNSDLEGWCGAYVWLEGFSGSFKKLNLIYSSGIAYAGLGANFSKSEFTENTQLALSDEAGKWLDVSINIAKDHDDHAARKFANLGLDRLVINLGTWTINDGADFPYGIYFSEMDLSYGANGVSTIDKQKIQEKPEEKTWWLGKYLPFTHVAGDHRYIMGTKKMEAKR